MATLILTAAGTAIAGPLGGAVGAIVGQAADQALFGPKARRGPRLGDLSVQTSSYGSDIPKLFGKLRVAGTVIWATDLVQTRSSSGGGKGRPASVNYSYHANFAVALSARRLLAVHRIWADGKLLRGAAGDLKVRGRFRFHSGDEDQAVDPLIASDLGMAAAPAFRGTAYAVFEELDLTDFGNRIPSLTFEVEADGDGIAIGEIASTLSGGLITAAPTPAVGGYAASGDSLRSAIMPLVETAALSIVAAGDRLRLMKASGPPAEVPAQDFAAPPEVTRLAAAAMAGEVSLFYYEEGRDYQAGVQRARRRGGSAAGELRNLPATLGAQEAKRFAEERLAALWLARISCRLRLLPRGAANWPGSLVRIAGQQGIWKVSRWLFDSGGVTLTLTRVAEAAAGAGPASAGDAIRAPDLVHGPTSLRLLDLPLGLAADRPSLFVLANGTEAGWRRAAILFSDDDGATWREAVSTAHAAVLGTAVGALGPGGSALIDAKGSVEVQLIKEGLWLESCTDSALAQGSNLALLGSELIQFGRAEALGGGRVRLSRLLRGRRGTEAAAFGHSAGEDFALLEAAAMLPVPVPLSAVGGRAVAMALGIGDPPDGAEAALTVSGEALRPPSPAHLSARLTANGDLVVRWVRRSRAGWDWTSGSDTPLAEERELYSVTLTSGASAKTLEVAGPELLYSSADQAADGILFPVSIAVSQLGTFAASAPALTTFG